MKYSASSRLDVSRLAMNLSTTPETMWPKMLAIVYDLRLMRLQWSLGFVVWLGRVRGLSNRQALLVLFSAMAERDKSAINDAMEGVVKHCLHGRDTEDKDSVGGWSQREIDALMAVVTFSNDAGK